MIAGQRLMRLIDAMKDEGRLAGATGWLVKPFDPNKLIEVVQKVTRQRGA